MVGLLFAALYIAYCAITKEPLDQAVYTSASVLFWWYLFTTTIGVLFWFVMFVAGMAGATSNRSRDVDKGVELAVESLFWGMGSTCRSLLYLGASLSMCRAVPSVLDGTFTDWDGHLMVGSTILCVIAFLWSSAAGRSQASKKD